MRRHNGCNHIKWLTKNQSDIPLEWAIGQAVQVCDGACSAERHNSFPVNGWGWHGSGGRPLAFSGVVVVTDLRASWPMRQRLPRGQIHCPILEISTVPTQHVLRDLWYCRECAEMLPSVSGPDGA